MSEQQPKRQDNSRVITRLLASVMIMFAFGFALVPLYEKFCEVTGFNGRTSNTAATADESMQIDQSRVITVEFHTRVSRGVSWDFTSEVRSVRLHPGEVKIVNFYVENKTNRDVVAQALPSVAPGEASLYLNKTECFCFENQPLAAGERAVMPMQFYLDPDLPDHVHRLTLSYMMYDLTDQVRPRTASANRSE
ncbi:cytochrome c oxidase assembly protein [Aliidiomarina halalkaliphila]|uniref:Cytochrome c oxidase assembly protein CtaG n=1 Tax=Aliidiomarina halalkaliphila TaxID=2593535 RepID=A0A552X1W6_9GAMM|nr:cytochrome c oxidase assembly protein [Aliidiomarina halalkaliphila]TRW49004.1 cytochrome c oxidase assembly protein [Aliidiomarina halalkaliphila]